MWHYVVMPKNRHLTFGDMQAQKSREEHLAKLRAMMKPAEADEPSQPDRATTSVVSDPKVASKPTPQKTAAPAKKAAAKPAPKKAAAKKPVGKKKGKK